MAHFKRKESDPEMNSSKGGDDIELMITPSSIGDDGQADGNAHLIERRKDEQQSQLKSIGIFRLAAILFFMGYGGSYGVEGTIKINK